MKKNGLKGELLSSIREIVFGAEDSLVSTLGAVTGMAVGTQSTFLVILSGVILIAVESTSMAAGSYLSSKSARNMDRVLNGGTKQKQDIVHSIRGAIVMWFSYAIAGIFPLLFYFFLPTSQAYLPSILLTALMLFLLGFWVGKITKQSPIKSGLEMVSVSLFAALIGYLIGRLLPLLLGMSPESNNVIDCGKQ